jgi:hypothetical protein
MSKGNLMNNLVLLAVGHLIALITSLVFESADDVDVLENNVPSDFFGYINAKLIRTTY